MDRATAERVRRRASALCEYCLIPQEFDALPFQIDHIVARKHGGAGTDDNLALICLACNVHKGPNIAGLDPLSGEVTRLFHPRRDRWMDHFEWNGPDLAGISACGRATVAVLRINLDHRVLLRESLQAEGRFPFQPAED